MNEPLATYYAVFRSMGAHNQVFCSIHPELEDAKKKVDFEVASAERMAKFLPDGFDDSTYIVVAVPIVYVGQWKRNKDAEV